MASLCTLLVRAPKSFAKLFFRFDSSVIPSFYSSLSRAFPAPGFDAAPLISPEQARAGERPTALGRFSPASWYQKQTLIALDIDFFSANSGIELVTYHREYWAASLMHCDDGVS